MARCRRCGDDHILISARLGFCGPCLRRHFDQVRPEAPLLTAGTLLVPGYVNLEEIFGLAQFIARLNPEIPYSLLAFYPQFYLTDLPTTPKDLALAARQTALEAGLKHVRLGNTCCSKNFLAVTIPGRYERNQL
jgi:pyruvate-formate lyase-activating enzyme